MTLTSIMQKFYNFNSKEIDDNRIRLFPLVKYFTLCLTMNDFTMQIRSSSLTRSKKEREREKL